LKHSLAEERIIQDVAADPTLPRTRKSTTVCDHCKGKEAVFFQAPIGRDEGMNLFFVCTSSSCNHRWKG